MEKIQSKNEKHFANAVLFFVTQLLDWQDFRIINRVNAFYNQGACGY